MQSSDVRGDKPTDDSSDIELIDESTIRRLADEHTDDDGCRFGAVARSLESVSPPNTPIELPVTRVAYVDSSGQYAIERQFPGHRPDWQEIPRTAVVTDESTVRKLPSAHAERYAPVLETVDAVLSEAD